MTVQSRSLPRWSRLVVLATAVLSAAALLWLMGIIYPYVLADSSIKFAPPAVRDLIAGIGLLAVLITGWLAWTAKRRSYLTLAILCLAAGWMGLCFSFFDPTIVALTLGIAGTALASLFWGGRALRWALILFGLVNAGAILWSYAAGLPVLHSPGHVPRPGGILGNPIAVGFILAAAALCLFREWEMSPQKQTRAVIAAIGFLTLAGLTLTFSRGPAVGLAVGGLFLLLGRRKKVGLVFFAAALAAILCIVGVRSHNAAGARSAEVSASRRPYFWSYAADTLQFTHGRGLGLHDADDSVVKIGNDSGPAISTTLSSLLQPVVQFGWLGAAWVMLFCGCLAADGWSLLKRQRSGAGLAFMALVLVCGLTYMVYLDRFTFAGTSALIFASIGIRT